ncbi:lytic transglycosylase domain-containing protein [Paenochrobactrum glaciei]
MRAFHVALTVSALGLVLTGCNTTSESGSSQTALLSSAAEGASASATSASSGEAVKTASEVAAETLAATQIASLQQSAPLPSSREAAIPAMAYAAGSPVQTSPVSVASNLAFKTPANAPAGLDELIQKYAATYEVPERLVRRVVHRESRFNPAARNGPYWGLMQISHPTARGMGYRGAASGLLDAETNLKYAVKYLSGAYKVAEGDETQAVKFYARGYYYDAKRKGLLEETGLRPARK